MIQEIKYSNISIINKININELNKQFCHICIFDSNSDENTSTKINFSKIIALGCVNELLENQTENVLDKLQSFIDTNKSWVFGYLSYDLKNVIENLVSEKDDGLHFPILHFFVPEIVIQIKEDITTVFYENDFISKEKVIDTLKLFVNTDESSEAKSASLIINSKITKREYLNSVNILKQHIHKGDIYEINFCQEFYSENASVNIPFIYNQLNEISKAPFSAYCKFEKNYLISSSPERFLQKTGNTLISQPIKGTAKRNENNSIDEKSREELKMSEKERSENVMIVDLVRNDLSRIARRGSLNVDELFGVYSFKQVHQMISSVSCELKENISFAEIINSTFPMGSMTGAPKVNAMKLIEQFEKTKRGLYSGAVGYISPDGDFDFSVVIRSILYNEENKYLSFMVGSAITDKSIAESEYEECLAKAKAMFDVLTKD